ncbi:hypothetical protein FOL46_006230 [Perkinsus olseni]|uniref:Uncharacterized protein n=1 Tax=Perkinsus olseni TaxID=32597 RepID=A0A7J6MZF0_PEROL|nr:hypothetical protein FOL46_006230 [Perkinsus olseni]
MLSHATRRGGSTRACRLCSKVLGVRHVSTAAQPGLRGADNAFNSMFELADEKRNHLQEIVDEIMTLELRDARDLADVLEATLDSENFITTSVIPGRQPFPHPMHMFSGLDAATRPGMYQPYGLGGRLPQLGTPTTTPAVPQQVNAEPAITSSPPEPKAPQAEAAAAAPAQTSSVVTLKLVSYEDGKKVTVVKEVRALLGLGLKESKEMVEDLPKVKATVQPVRVEYGYHLQQQQWSRPQPGAQKGRAGQRLPPATEMSPISVASAPSPQDSEGNVSFGMPDAGEGPHILGARRGLPAGQTSMPKRRRASSPPGASSSDDEWRHSPSSSSSDGDDVDHGSLRAPSRRPLRFHPLLSGKCDSREFDKYEPRLLEMDGPLWQSCGRRIVPVSPVLQLTPDTVCRVSKVIAAEKRCIGLDVVGVPAPKLPDNSSKRSIVDHLVIATMHGVTIIGPAAAAAAAGSMCKDMLAAQLIGHLKLYRNTVHVVIPRTDVLDRACRFLGFKHGALAGMINVVQWVRKWATSKKTHGAAILAKNIIADLEASGGGELSVESLCGFFLPYKPHFTGPPKENLERLPNNVRSHTMAHVAFFTRKVFRMFYDRAADPDGACRADSSEGARETDCVSVVTSEEGAAATPITSGPNVVAAGGKSPMARLSTGDVQDLEGVAMGIRLPKAGRVVTADSTAKALPRQSLPPPLPPGRPITSTDRPPTNPSPIERGLVERAPRPTEKQPFPTERHVSPTERQPRPTEGACGPSQRSRPPLTRRLPKPDVPKEGARGILERMRELQARLNTLASANAGGSTSTQRPADHSADSQDRRGRKRPHEECEPAAPQTSSSAKAPTGEVVESTSDETGGDLPQLSREQKASLYFLLDLLCAVDCIRQGEQYGDLLRCDTVMANTYDYYAGQGYDQQQQQQQQAPIPRLGVPYSNRSQPPGTVPMPLPRYAPKRSWEAAPWQQQQQQGQALDHSVSAAAWAPANNSNNGGTWQQQERYKTRQPAIGHADADAFSHYLDASRPPAAPRPLPFHQLTPDAGWPPPLSSLGVAVAKPLPPGYRPHDYRDLDSASIDRQTVSIARPMSHPLEQQQAPQRVVGVLTMIDASRGLIQSEATGASKIVFHVSQCSNAQQKQTLADRVKRGSASGKKLPVTFTVAQLPNGTCVAKSVSVVGAKPNDGKGAQASAPSGPPVEVLERARKVQEAAVAAVASAKAMYPPAQRGKGPSPKAKAPNNRKRRNNHPKAGAGPRPPPVRGGKPSNPKKSAKVASPRGSAPVKRSPPVAKAKEVPEKPVRLAENLAPNDLANPNAPLLGGLAQLTIPPGFPPLPPGPPPHATSTIPGPPLQQQQPSAGGAPEAKASSKQQAEASSSSSSSSSSSTVVRDWRVKAAAASKATASASSKEFAYKRSAEHPLRLVKASNPPKPKSPAKTAPEPAKVTKASPTGVPAPPAEKAKTKAASPSSVVPPKPSQPKLPIESRSGKGNGLDDLQSSRTRSMSHTSSSGSSAVSPISVATSTGERGHVSIPEDDLDFTYDSDSFSSAGIIFKEGWLPSDPPTVTVTLLGSTCEDVARVIRRICAEKSCVSLDVVDVPIERGYSTRSTVLAIGTRHGISVIGCDGPNSGRAKSDNVEWTVARTILANHLFGRASSRSSTVPLVVDNSNGASRLCRFLGMYDLSREEALQSVDIIDAIKKMLVQSEKGGGGLPPRADSLMKDIRMFHDARSIPVTLASLCNYFHRPHRVRLGSAPHTTRAFDLGHIAFYTRRVFQQFNKRFTAKAGTRKRKRQIATEEARVSRNVANDHGTSSQSQNSSAQRDKCGPAVEPAQGRLLASLMASSPSLPPRDDLYRRFRVVPSADDSHLVHRKAIWDARGCKPSLDESELLEMSNDTLVDYLRILHFNEIDLYFLLNESTLVHASKPIAYENPCNERKALFLAKKVLTSHGASTQRVAKLQNKIDSFCRPASNVRISSEVEVSNPYVAEVAPKCVVGNRSSDLGGGVGLYAKENVSAGDDVIRVPEGDSRIINIYAAAADEDFGPVVESLLAAGHHIDTCLLMYLVHIYKSPKLRSLPAIACFVQYLPTEFSGNLMEWPLEALDALGIPQIKQLVSQQMDLLWGIHRALPAGLCGSFDDELLWARSLCDSRAFALEVPPPSWCPHWLKKYLTPDQPITCVVPGADLLNHHQQGQCGFPRFDKESRSFVITAEANVPAGSELFINYGGLQNWEQLMYYGFCEFTQNPYDSVTLDLAAAGAEEGLQLDRIGTEHIIRRGQPTVSPRLWEALTNMAGVENLEQLEEDAVVSLITLLRQVTLAPLPESPAANDWWTEEYGSTIKQFRSSQMALVDEAERVLRQMVDKDRKARIVRAGGGQGGRRKAKSAKKRR